MICDVATPLPLLAEVSRYSWNKESIPVGFTDINMDGQ